MPVVHWLLGETLEKWAAEGISAARSRGGDGNAQERAMPVSWGSIQLYHTYGAHTNLLPTLGRRVLEVTPTVWRCSGGWHGGVASGTAGLSAHVDHLLKAVRVGELYLPKLQYSRRIDAVLEALRTIAGARTHRPALRQPDGFRTWFTLEGRLSAADDEDLFPRSLPR